jgi:hypothetical protein
VQPFLWQDMLAGIDAYLDRHGIASVGDLVGTLNMGDA